MLLVTGLKGACTGGILDLRATRFLTAEGLEGTAR